VTRRGSATVAALAWCICCASGLAAQTTGALVGGVSYVDYDGFLPSAAFYLVPSVQFTRPGFSLGGRASWVVFESGNSVLQGSAAGGWLTPMGGLLRAELSGSAGMAAYTATERYGHVLFRGRLHLAGRRMGAWLGGVTGRSFLGGDSDTPVEISLGGWMVQPSVTFGASATRTWFGDLVYLDVEGRLDLELRGFELRYRGGLRAWTDNVDEGLYGEVLIHVPVSRRLAAELGGGTYPSDPVRGILAASYASIGVRVSTSPMRRAIEASETLARAYNEEPEGESAVAARLEVDPRQDEAVRLRVHAPGAAKIELMGDFTDWVPLVLERTGAQDFVITLAVAPGVHRLNIRVDGGDWIVPRGMRAEQDEFGGTVGVLVIP
jgi:hypothetical protein